MEVKDNLFMCAAKFEVAGIAGFSGLLSHVKWLWFFSLFFLITQRYNQLKTYHIMFMWMEVWGKYFHAK